VRQSARPNTVGLFRRDRVFETLEADGAFGAQVAGNLYRTIPHLFVSEIFREEHLGDILTEGTVLGDSVREGLILSPVRHTIRL
jgi:hypothetical protein